MPVLERSGRAGKEYSFDTAAVIEWRMNEQVAIAKSAGAPRAAGEPGDATQRKANAEAQLAELKAERELGRFIAIDVVEREWLRLIANCRSKMLAVPSTSAPLAFSAETVDEARTYIENAVHEALNELADSGDRDADEVASERLSGDEGIEDAITSGVPAAAEINS